MLNTFEAILAPAVPGVAIIYYLGEQTANNDNQDIFYALGFLRTSWTMYCPPCQAASYAPDP